MHINSTSCQEFAQILKSTIIEENPCTVTRKRNIKAEIAGRETNSPLALNALFSFESPDREGRTLNLGETVILQNEINPFIDALREQGIKVTGFHNHWLFDDPRLLFIHFFSIDKPLAFARKVAEAFELLENNEKCPPKEMEAKFPCEEKPKKNICKMEFCCFDK